MRWNVAICFFVVMFSLAADGKAQSQQEVPSSAKKDIFAQFLGVNGGPVSPPMTVSDKDIWGSLSYVRGPIPWDQLQPSGPTEWKEDILEEYGKVVLANLGKGVRVLPVLGYSNPWAASKEAWSYVSDGKRYDVGAFDGRPDLRAVKITTLASGKSSTSDCRTHMMPPENVADWEKYVDGVVSFLARPPYNIEYFQIWNEANDVPTGFWHGNMDAYMKTIHLPAARIIRKYGAKVVYGGYPCNGSMPHLISVLDKHHAWDTLDVLDIHYFRLADWQYLYDKTKGKAKTLGIWQTEVGFVTSPSWVPNHFPRFFHWALTHGWQPDRYKIMHFGFWSPDDPKAFGYNCCFLAGDRYTCHGNALIALGQLLSGPVVEPYDHWKSTPELHTEIDESRASIEGFRCGNRIVFAVHLASSETELVVAISDLDAQKVSKAFRVGIYGSKTPLEVTGMHGEKDIGGIQLRVSARDTTEDEQKANDQSPLQTFYIVLDLSS